ncbi:serine/threonine-protein kinase ULK4-like isoform X2 [Oscarella lobularis]|uniref:serine/threonine-protein kinase ULK4-like isoform X2 n=1 Tax=Oscarella lobularis TaxID=121494 RepID=UPI00331415F6
MENFVLYDELQRGTYSIVYKGRRKSTIDFVAIQCWEKTKKEEVANSVRVLNALDHANVVQFVEWYETDNHMWVITELCTGGTLDDIITQDGTLPESTIRQFATHLVSGLSYIHSMGLVVSDVSPKKIWVDTNGVLKFYDFSRTLLPLEEGSLPPWISTHSSLAALSSDSVSVVEEDLPGDPFYLAPEVLLGQPCTPASDAWSLGCVVYVMFCGEPPFFAQSFAQVVERTLGDEIKIMKGLDKPSRELCDLTFSLLIKDSHKRLLWPDLFSHPFWNGSFDLNSFARFEANNANGNVDASLTLQGTSQRVQTAPEPQHRDAVFSLSARPATAKSSCQNAKRVVEKESIVHSSKALEDILYHSSDSAVSPIFSSNKMNKIPVLKWESKALPFSTIAIKDFKEIKQSVMDVHLTAIEQSLQLGSRSAGSRKSVGSVTSPATKLHVAAYLVHLSQDADAANYIVNSPLIQGILAVLKSGQTSDLKFRLCLVLGNLARHATLISQDLNLSELLLTLTEVVRENLKNVQLRQTLIAAIGEYMFYVASEEREGRRLPRWEIPQSAYSLMTRSLRDESAPSVQIYAAKTIDNMTTTSGRHVEVFANQDVSVALWNVYVKGSVDSLKFVSLSALCRLIRYSPLLGQSLLERIGVKPIVNLLKSSQSKIQQIVVTFCYALLSRNMSVRKLLLNEEFLRNVMLLLENPSPILRAKAYLTVALSAQNSSETLLDCCQSKLVLFIERDHRRLVSGKKDDEGLAYLSDCLNFTVSVVTGLIPSILEGILKCLSSVHGRRHPSNSQLRQISSNLPLLPIVSHVCSSHVLLALVVNDVFIGNLGDLLFYSAGIDSGLTELGSNPVLPPDDICECAFNTLLSSLAFLSSGSFLEELYYMMPKKILPALAQFLDSASDDRKLISINLMEETVQLLLQLSDRKVVELLDTFVNSTLLSQLPGLLNQRKIRQAGLQLLLVLVDKTVQWLPTIAPINDVIDSLMNIMEDCSSNPESMETVFVVMILKCLAVSSHLDRNLLSNRNFFSLLTSLIKHLTKEQSEMKEQESFAWVATVNVIDCVTAQLQFLLACDGITDTSNEQRFYHKPLVECLPSLVGLIQQEETVQSASFCLQALLSIYSVECHALVDSKDLDVLLHALTMWKDEASQLGILQVIRELLEAPSILSSRKKSFVKNVKDHLGKTQRSESLDRLVAEIMKKLT